MNTLLVGFDSAWTPGNSGAIVGVLLRPGGNLQEIGLPLTVDFREAERVLLAWQAKHEPTSTIVLLDQPTIVKNATGQRPVEHIICSAVSLRYGGMQPANIARDEMFGGRAPVWPFLSRFGGPADPMGLPAGTQVFETYPVLTMISLGWTLPDPRPAGRLPKYNPERKKTFSRLDWKYVCDRTLGAFSNRGLIELEQWIDDAARIESPRKRDQDHLGACLCLLVAVHLAEGKSCLMVGDLQSGYIVVPDGARLRTELESRCAVTRRRPSEWVRVFQRSAKVVPS